MKTKYCKIFIAILVASSLFASCEIERRPKGSMDAGQITGDPDGSMESLLNGTYAQMKNWSDPMHRCGEYAGDNIVIRGSSTDAFYEFISYKRTASNYRLTQFWDNSYKAIAQASNIIKMVKEGQSPEVDNKLGECYFLRGMNYFYLCRAYGRPYYQSPETNLGVPIVNGTPDNALNAVLPDRSTVKETYAQAIADLTKAAEMMTIKQSAAYASKEAAWAMLSRVYLYMSGTWASPNNEYATLSVKYAELVINSGKHSLLSRAEFMKSNTIVPENNKESIFVIKRVASEFSGGAHNDGIGSMYAAIGGMGWGEMYASAKYIDLLDETGRNDWRKGTEGMVDARAAFIEPVYTDAPANSKVKRPVFRFIRDVFDTDGNFSNYLYMQDSIKYNATTGAPIINGDGTIDCWEGYGSNRKNFKIELIDATTQAYKINYSDGKTYNGYIDNFIKLNREYPMFFIVKCSRENGEESHLHSPIISRLSEVYLNRAEAYAKMGEYGKALLDLNMVRERSLPGKGYASLNATNASTLIEKERQLELAYQAERSYDVYRNGLDLTRNYPGPQPKETVKPTDYRVTYFIPQDAINSYKPNVLTQNPTN